MTEQVRKEAYSTPRVVEFGSVRNLTGGSTMAGMDISNGQRP